MLLFALLNEISLLCESISFTPGFVLYNVIIINVKRMFYCATFPRVGILVRLVCEARFVCQRTEEIDSRPIPNIRTRYSKYLVEILVPRESVAAVGSRSDEVNEVHQFT
jgi:hypothetical protein